MKPNLVICFDPGVNLGHCAFYQDYLVSYGTTTSKPTEFPSIQHRLNFYLNEIPKIIKEYKDLTRDKFKPSKLKVLVVVEDSSFTFANTRKKNKYTWLVVAIYSLILAVCGRLNLPVVVYTPTEIKKRFTGSGRASKEDMERCFEDLEEFEGEKVDNHVIDAIAMYVAYAAEWKNSTKIRRSKNEK